MAGNGLRRFEIRLENGVFKIARPHITTGVHVHCGQRFRLVDDEVAPRFQLHATPQRFGDFFVDGVQIKNRALPFVQLQALGRFGHELAAKRLQLGKLLLRVDANALGGLAHQVAQHALQQRQVLVQQGSRRQTHRGLLDAGPGLAQIRNVFLQLFIAGVFGIGAQNKATTGRTHQSLQP